LKVIGSIALFFFLYCPLIFSQTIHLEGQWKFHVGDQKQWSATNFNDATWESIHVPSHWEDEGFNGYDGFGWYRKKFDGTKLDKSDTYYLGLGFIDDCDEVYLNGKLIGFSGSMPPHFKTAYNNVRKYTLPSDAINYTGANVIAVRVFDGMHGGGIFDGDIGIFPWVGNDRLLIDLQGIWSFATTDDDKPIKNESDWENIMVPEPWEHQGFHYDGYAWYKKTFILPAKMPASDLVLLLGKIDDFDKVYLNGVLIGTTNDHRPYGRSYSFEKDRVYPIPEVALKKNGTNTIEVFVEDMGNVGGIYEGVVGITSRTNYEKYFR
jgi:hypothetical protein